MRLIAAARRFDRLVFADIYTPATTFMGQLDVFDDSRRDGMSIERRILSVDPAVTIPARRTLLADGLTWLVGDSQRDYYNEAALRHKYVVHQATELVSVKTFAEAIAASAGLQAWASRVWSKGTKEIEESSDIFNSFNIYFTTSEAVLKNHLIYMGGQWHLVRSVYPSSAGMLVAVADELPEPMVTSVTFTSKVYVRATDTYTTTPTTITGVAIRWQTHFSYLIPGVSTFKQGDMVLMVRKADVTPVATDTVVVSGTTYIIDDVKDEGTVWALHLCVA